jgi:LmbE family N-acetylglucosaminyl deacetylase
MLVVAPHPDDETLGAGGLIQRVLARGGRVRVVALTAGDGYREALARLVPGRPPGPSDFLHYGSKRIDELEAALEVLGDGRIRLEVLGFPDGGLQALLVDRSGRSLPLRSATTATESPPYPDAADRTLSYRGEDLRRALSRILADERPTLVVIPDPADRHPDHSAGASFALASLRDPEVERALRAHPPRVATYLIHWPGWPTPAAGTAGAAPFALPADLPARGLAIRTLWLDASELERKRDALARHDTQQRAMGPFLALFERRGEVFRLLDTTRIDPPRTARHAPPRTK